MLICKRPKDISDSRLSTFHHFPAIKNPVINYFLGYTEYLSIAGTFKQLFTVHPLKLVSNHFPDIWNPTNILLIIVFLSTKQGKSAIKGKHNHKYLDIIRDLVH